MKIAILGAPATGKTCLALELARHLPDLHISDDPLLTQVRPGAFDLILLTGLDLPRADPDQQQADGRLRAALQETGISYGVVYGQGSQRLRAALRLISPQDGPPPRWAGVCERCADPDCEFRLFTGLKSSTAADRPRS